jgi:hypothetical protein
VGPSVRQIKVTVLSSPGDFGRRTLRPRQNCSNSFANATSDKWVALYIDTTRNNCSPDVLVALVEWGVVMRNSVIGCLAAAACVATVLGACSSYETTYFSRDENGQIVTKTVAGVPIVVTAPQKLGFIATESRYLFETRTVDDSGKISIARREATEVSVDKSPISLGQSQVVNLDIKRPVYGTAKTKMTLANQYPTEVSSDVDDKTLDRVLNTIEKFIEKQGEQNQPSPGNTTKTLLSQRTYMIVYDPATQKISRTPI